MLALLHFFKFNTNGDNLSNHAPFHFYFLNCFTPPRPLANPHPGIYFQMYRLFFVPMKPRELGPGRWDVQDPIWHGHGKWSEESWRGKRRRKIVREARMLALFDLRGSGARPPQSSISSSLRPLCFPLPPLS